MLKSIKDPEIRSQIIDRMDKSSTNSAIEREEIPSQKGPYTMSEVKRILKAKTQAIDRPTTIQDMEEEIHNLKKEIAKLKATNVVLDRRISNLEKHDLSPDIEKQDLSPDIIETSTSNTSTKEVFLLTIDSADDEFIQKLELITSQKFFFL